MHPEKLGIEACDLESLQRNQSTQTNTVSIDKVRTPSSKTRLPLPRDFSKSDKGSVTVFEFCQILQDPESPQDVTVIKDTVTEETKPHTSNLEDSTANRYKYCREVIKPYLKQSLGCPESEEELLKNVFDSLSEDFPDYQPCFEVFEGENDRSDKTNNSRRSSISKVDASTSYSNMEENKDKKCVSKSKSTEEVAPKCPTPAEKCKEPVDESSPKPKCVKKKSAEGKKKCSPKPSISSTRCDKEPTIGVKCENPSYYLTERCKDTDSIPNIPEPEPEDTIESHKRTISTIKVAVEDFVTKVYKSTKDAVTLITTESAKQLDKIKKSEISNTDAPKTYGENKSSETVTSFNFFRKVDSTDKQDKGSGSKPELPKISDVIGTIMDKVDSSLSMLSEHMSFDMPECFKPHSFNDLSSEYDKPSPPRKVSNIYIPEPEPVPVSNSVFATIKDKICSMFYDEPRQQVAEPKSQESEADVQKLLPKSSSSNTVKDDENDDYLVDKVIE